MGHARELLFQGELHDSLKPPHPGEKFVLACAYAAAVAQASIEYARSRLEELFQQLGLLANTWSTKTHYSLWLIWRSCW